MTSPCIPLFAVRARPDDPGCQGSSHPSTTVLAASALGRGPAGFVGNTGSLGETFAVLKPESETAETGSRLLLISDHSFWYLICTLMHLAPCTLHVLLVYFNVLYIVAYTTYCRCILQLVSGINPFMHQLDFA